HSRASPARQDSSALSICSRWPITAAAARFIWCGFITCGRVASSEEGEGVRYVVADCPSFNVGYIRTHRGFVMLNSVAPFFIVDDLGATLAFYQSKLAFDVRYKGGGDGNTGDFWAILGRDRVMLMFKAITPEVHPQPNRS